MRDLVGRLLALCALLLCCAPAAHAGWAEDALTKEANYIADASFSEAATHHAGAAPSSAGYGAINDVRIDQSGPDWVQPQESAVAAIGLMGAARQLKPALQDTACYDAVLGHFFRTWLLASRQGMDVDRRDADYGAFARRVFYDKSGHWQCDGGYNSGTTGMTVIALWKHSEYLEATGRAGDAACWRQAAWPLAKTSGEYLRRRLNPAYHLVQGSAAAPDLWTSDSVYTALHDPVLLDRARRRFEWANKSEYAALWLGTGTRLEANVGNGLVDWRDGDNYAHKAENWQRFVDTSAYFIGMTLRVCYGRDTKLVPE